jgi:hypothetical protein
MTDEQKSDQKSKKIKISLTSVALFVAILPVLLTPPLMDVRFWFTEYVSAMDYSASNIYEVWQQYLLPGRFVPISDFYVTTYIFLGHKFLQVTQAPLNYFDALTKLTLLVLLFFTIRSLFVEVGKGFKESSKSNLMESLSDRTLPSLEFRVKHFLEIQWCSCLSNLYLYRIYSWASIHCCRFEKLASFKQYWSHTQSNNYVVACPQFDLG